MMMCFEFNEDRLKKHNLTKEQCFSVIDKVMNQNGIYAKQSGTYITSEKSGFDDENDVDWDDVGADCIHSIYIYGV